MVNNEDTNSRVFALRAAQFVGCSGAHKFEGKWMPCQTHEELQRLSEEAEPKQKTSLTVMNERYETRRAKGKKKRKGWEQLRERKPLGFATLEGGGIVSAPIVAFPNVELFSNKSYIPGVSPRDDDSDVFTNIESARQRSRSLGCIGVRRMPSSSGRTVWMPCTNNSDYSRLAGTSFLGRRNRDAAQKRVIRTIVRGELNLQKRRSTTRKKSLVSELTETKGIGNRIGRAVSHSSFRTTRRALTRIEGTQDPRQRRDVDGDGMIFDGTWREMPDPNTNRTSRSRSNQTQSPQDPKPSWAAPTQNTWMTKKRIEKGGVLKATELLNFDRVRMRSSKEEKARVLGVTVDVLNAMSEPDASLSPFDADRLSMSALGLHPALIWGESWLMEDAKEPELAKERSRYKGKKRGIEANPDLTEQENMALEMSKEGKSQTDIAQELKLKKSTLQKLLERARRKIRNSNTLSEDEKTEILGNSRIMRGPKAQLTLTKKESQVLNLLDNGMSQADAARELGLTTSRISQLRISGDKKRTALSNDDDDRSARSSSGNENPMTRGDGMILRDGNGRPIRQVDRRQETLEQSIKKMKDLGLSDEEINLLFTGNRNTPVDTVTRDVDISRQGSKKLTRIDDEIPGGNTRSARSMSISEMESASPKTWPTTQKTHITNWGNSRPSFNIPYALAQKYIAQGDLSDSEWKRLLNLYKRFGPESSRSARSISGPSTTITNVGARRMGQIILDKVKPENRDKKSGTKNHFHIVGPGGMGKSTLAQYLRETKMIPNDTEAADVDPDFIKQGIIGYNGGSGSSSVHRESAQAATRVVNDAAEKGMDIITEGTGYRLLDYKTTNDNSYKKIVHIPFSPYSVAEERVRQRNAKGGRQLPVEQVRAKGGQLYGWLTDHIMNGQIQDMYIWDTDVPLGAAPTVIAKIENGVFRAIDEPKFKTWSEQHGGRRGGDSNLAWFQRRFPIKNR